MSEQTSMSNTAKSWERLMLRVVSVLTNILTTLAALVILTMMISTVADVSRRYFAGTPIAGVTEMGEVLMVMSVFFGIAYAERRGAHVRVTLLLDSLPKKVSTALHGMAMLAMLALVAWMVWVTTGRALESLTANEVRFGLVQIPVWPGRLAIALGLAAYFFEAATRLVITLRSEWQQDTHEADLADNQCTKELEA